MRPTMAGTCPARFFWTSSQEPQRPCGTNVGVTSEVEVNWRGLAGYSVQFQIQDTLKLTVRELERQ